MLITAYVISIVGVILLPIILWIIFTRQFVLSWKLVLAGGLTFIASQIPHIPLVLGLNGILKSMPLLVNAIVLGLLAGIFEETARYILFTFILKKSRSWQEGILVGLGHGGMEALLIGISVAATVANMIAYRNVNLSTVSSIPPEQLELAKQQVSAFWSSAPYMALITLLERVFAMCLHINLSVMVLYAVAYQKPAWFWLAVLWHTLVDATAVYMGQTIGALQVEGLIAIFALISIWVVFIMRTKSSETKTISKSDQATV